MLHGCTQAVLCLVLPCKTATRQHLCRAMLSSSTALAPQCFVRHFGIPPCCQMTLRHEAPQVRYTILHLEVASCS